MVSRQYIFVTLILATLSSIASPYPSGAPEGVCDSLAPHHGSNRAKHYSTSPYSLTQTYSDYQPGDKIKVVLRAPDGLPFKGLLVQAVDENTNQRIGSFEEGRGLKILSCAAVTHSDSRPKRQATLVWNAPSTGSGRVAFKGTVVQRFSDFWTGLQSDVNPNI